MPKATLDQVTAGVMRYFEAEVQPHLPSDGLRGFGVGFASVLALSRVGDIIRSISTHPAVAMLGVVDPDGRVDIDALYKAASQAMPPDGVQVGVLGHQLRFHAEDLKKLRDMIAQQ